jgi:hypothetical protein
MIQSSTAGTRQFTSEATLHNVTHGLPLSGLPYVPTGYIPQKGVTLSKSQTNLMSAINPPKDFCDLLKDPDRSLRING